MKRSILSVCIACAILGLITVPLGFEWSATPVAAEEAVTVTIQVSPSTIVMSSLGGCVSVHTDIRYASVVKKTVELNGLSPYLVKPDLRGDLVAKFNLEPLS